MTAISDATRVILHQLHVSDEDGEAVIGRADTGTFVSLPPEGLVIIQWLQSGLSTGQVRQRFVERYAAEPDLRSLLDDLCTLDFVESIDGQPVADSSPGSSPRGWQLLGNVPTRRVAWVLSWPARRVYLAIWLAVPILFLLRPDLVPRPSEALVADGPMVNFIALTGLGWTLVFLHEVAHVIATRALDCPSYLSISHRLHFLVGQTDMTALRTQPRTRRTWPYLAGMTWDLIVLLACTGLRLGSVDSRIVTAIAFLAMVGLVFQCAVFMRTDIYFLLCNWLHLDNLIPDTRSWVANGLHRALRQPEPHDLSVIPARQRRILPWYAAFCIAGVAIAVGDFVFLGLPVVAKLVRSAVRELAFGPREARFWEGFAFMSTITLHFLLLAAVSIQDWHARRSVAGMMKRLRQRTRR